MLIEYNPSTSTLVPNIICYILEKIYNNAEFE